MRGSLSTHMMLAVDVTLPRSSGVQMVGRALTAFGGKSGTAPHSSTCQ